MKSYKMAVGNPEVKEPLGRLGTDGKAIKICHIQLIRKFGLVSTGYVYGPVTNFCLYDHEQLGVVQAEKSLDQPNGC